MILDYKAIEKYHGDAAEFHHNVHQSLAVLWEMTEDGSGISNEDLQKAIALHVAVLVTLVDDVIERERPTLKPVP